MNDILPPDVTLVRTSLLNEDLLQYSYQARLDPEQSTWNIHFMNPKLGDSDMLPFEAPESQTDQVLHTLLNAELENIQNQKNIHVPHQKEKLIDFISEYGEEMTQEVKPDILRTHIIYQFNMLSNDKKDAVLNAPTFDMQ